MEQVGSIAERVMLNIAWEQMYAQHVAVARVLHERAGDDDPHKFGQETASCDWLADQVLEVLRAALAPAAPPACPTCEQYRQLIVL